MTFKFNYLGIKTILQFLTSEICHFSSGKQKHSFWFSSEKWQISLATHEVLSLYAPENQLTYIWGAGNQVLLCSPWWHHAILQITVLRHLLVVFRNYGICSRASQLSPYSNGVAWPKSKDLNIRLCNPAVVICSIFYTIDSWILQL